MRDGAARMAGVLWSVLSLQQGSKRRTTRLATPLATPFLLAILPAASAQCGNPWLTLSPWNGKLVASDGVSNAERVPKGEEKGFVAGGVNEDGRADLIVGTNLPDSFPGNREGRLLLHEKGTWVDRTARTVPLRRGCHSLRRRRTRSADRYGDRSRGPTSRRSCASIGVAESSRLVFAMPWPESPWPETADLGVDRLHAQGSGSGNDEGDVERILSTRLTKRPFQALDQAGEALRIAGGHLARCPIIA